MTVPVDRLPRWVRGIAKVAQYLAPGFIAAWVLLRMEGVKGSLTTTWTHPPTLIYDLMSMVVTGCAVIAIIFCGDKAMNIVKNIISNRND